MSTSNGSATMKENDSTTESKGKGKAVDTQTHEGMDVDDSSSEEEMDEADAVVEEPDEDNMEEIDLDNIIPDGRRTRGRQIDYAKAAQEMGPELDEDDDDDDDDFEAHEDEEMKD